MKINPAVSVTTKNNTNANLVSPTFWPLGSPGPACESELSSVPCPQSGQGMTVFTIDGADARWLPHSLQEHLSSFSSSGMHFGPIELNHCQYQPGRHFEIAFHSIRRI